jgi:putative hydrolase of the HAD superfamily
MNPYCAGIKSVLFDFGGTLDADGLSWKDQFYPIYRSAGLKWSLEDFEKHFYAADDFLTNMKLTQTSYAQTIARQVSLVLKNGGALKKSLAKRIADSYLEGALRNLKKNFPLLKRLKGTYSLGIVSNFYGNLPFIVQEIGLSPFFDAVVDSQRIGYQKPHPNIFLAALNELGTPPGRGLFVGDSLKRDMAGAKALGMKHIWLVNEIIKNPKPCCPQDLVIHSLRELEGILL